MLFGILVFNWLGYDLVVSVMNLRINHIAEANIEKGNYDQSQLIEIKVDLQLPYSIDWTDFEKVNGTVSYHGMVFNFVERKYENGQMIYRCLPNHRGTELQHARDYFYSLVYDMENQEKKNDSAPQHSTSVKKLNIESTVNDILAEADFNFSKASIHGHFINSDCLNGFGFMPAQPPEA